MGTRIVEFGAVPSGILAALIEKGYRVDACGTSILKLKETLQQPGELDAIALAESGAAKAVRVLAPVRTIEKIPIILFEDGSRTSDGSQFDLVIPEHAQLENLLGKVAALIEWTRAIRAETTISRERLHSLSREAASLRDQSVTTREQSVTTRVESQNLARATLKRPVTERVNIPCVLLVDDYARWRDAMRSMLKECVDCRLLCEAEDGIEAVQRATKLKPQLILLDLDLPRLNGIEAARQITQSTPESAILFVSMNNSADVVAAALSTGAKGYLLKADAGIELAPAIEAVLQNRQYLSRSLRGGHSGTIN